MKTPPVVHGSFTVERTFSAPLARVFAAWTDVETKARWFLGPPFERLAVILDDPREIVNARVFDAPRDQVFGAFADPTQLARWWGPNGFTNTIDEFDFRPGGAFRLVMRGPDGAEYQNASDFVEVVQPERIVLQHVQPMHTFTMTMGFVEVGRTTQLVWRMRFESDEQAEKVRGFIVDANEQNFDRLAAHLATKTAR